MSASILPLVLENVAYASNGQPIIAGVSLSIDAGPSTIILGANGAGKSVLMRLMHGLLAPSAGSVRWNEPDPASVRRRQAMVFQRPVMLRRSALANVIYALALAGVPDAEREAQALGALDEVGLRHLAHRPARDTTPHRALPRRLGLRLGSHTFQQSTLTWVGKSPL